VSIMICRRLDRAKVLWGAEGRGGERKGYGIYLIRCCVWGMEWSMEYGVKLSIRAGR
jgi:hypothetical protein